MAYQPVTRVVTVEFVPEEDGQDYEVRVTPEHLVMRYGDSITWVVQGLDPAVAQRLSIGNFHPKEGTVLVVTKSGTGLVPPDKPDFRPTTAFVQNSTAKIASNGALPGLYRYEILFDGHVLIDPDDEIKGPRH